MVYSLRNWLQRSIGFHTGAYKVTFTYTFFLMFGTLLLGAYLSGGMTSLMINTFVILVLISHEYAHVAECLRLYIPIRELKFTWFGGLVDADFKYTHEEIPVMLAGVVDTLWYLLLSVGLLLSFWVVGRFYIPFNLAVNPFLTLVVLMVLISISNLVPISYNHRKYGLITTDGWGAWLRRELRDEMWNDGSACAMTHYT